MRIKNAEYVKKNFVFVALGNLSFRENLQKFLNINPPESLFNYM